MLVFVRCVLAEPYKSEEFPPVELISKISIKNQEEFHKFARRKLPPHFEIVGKYRDGDGVYHLYFIFRNIKGKIELCKDPMTFIKLDTNVWLVKDPISLNLPQILEK